MNNTSKVLRASREDRNFELFYECYLKHVEIRACLHPPTLSPRRQRRNYQQMKTHFIVDGNECNDENLEIKAYVDGKCVKLKIVVENKSQGLENEASDSHI